MRSCFPLVAAILALPLSISAHATSITVSQISDANGRGVVGIDAAGDILIENLLANRFEIYNDGSLISTSVNMPDFVTQNGTACSVPAGVSGFGSAICDGPAEVYTDSGNPGANFFDIYPGSAPLGDFVFRGENFTLPPAGASRVSAALNSSGDFVYVDPSGEEIYEFSVATTPEPSSFLLLGTGLLGLLGVAKSRYAS